MLKIILFIGLCMVLLSVPIYAQSVTLIPNATHGMSYKETSDTSCDFDGFGTSPASATTAYTEADYANVNVSDNSYFGSAYASASKIDFVGDCIFNRYTFNVTLVNTTPILWIRYCIEGYYSTNNIGDMLDWRWQTIWLDNNNMGDSDATYCYNLTSIIDTYISNGIFSIGTDAGAYGDGVSASSTISYIDYVNVTVGFAGGAPPSDTCTYSGSGNWNININDNCTLSSTNTVTGNIYIYGSNGYLNFGANQLAHAFYYNVTSAGTWYYNNYRWLY